MNRMPRPALAALAGFVLVFAAACGSSASTPGAPGPSGAGATGAVNPQDPNSIISQVVSGGSDVKSFHIKLAVSGTVNPAVLGDSNPLGSLSGDMKLDGSSIEGDVDVANQAAHLSFALPTMALTGDLILVDNALYYKIASFGPMYSKMDLGSLSSSLGALSSSLPVAVPTAMATDMTGLTDQIDQLRTALSDYGVTATLVGVEKIGGKDASHITYSIPIDKINAEIAAAASPSSAPTIDSASVDVWVYTDNYRIAQLEVKGASADVGNVDITVTVSAYDEPVTISAPPASDINPTTP